MSKIVKFTTAVEFDPITSMALNARFTGFLYALALKRGIPHFELITEAKDIMTAAGIDQEDPSMPEEEISQITEPELCLL